MFMQKGKYPNAYFRRSIINVITDIILYIEIFDINLYISLIIYFQSHIIVFNELQII